MTPSVVLSRRVSGGFKEGTRFFVLILSFAFLMYETRILLNNMKIELLVWHRI